MYIVRASVRDTLISEELGDQGLCAIRSSHKRIFMQPVRNLKLGQIRVDVAAVGRLFIMDMYDPLAVYGSPFSR